MFEPALLAVIAFVLIHYPETRDNKRRDKRKRDIERELALPIASGIVSSLRVPKVC